MRLADDERGGGIGVDDDAEKAERLAGGEAAESGVATEPRHARPGANDWGKKEPVPERRFAPGLRPGVMAGVGVGADAEFAAASLHGGAECGEDF